MTFKSFFTGVATISLFACALPVYWAVEASVNRLGGENFHAMMLFIFGVPLTVAQLIAAFVMHRLLILEIQRVDVGTKVLFWLPPGLSAGVIIIGLALAEALR